MLAAHALRTRLRRLPPDADVAEALLRSAGVAFRREAPAEEHGDIIKRERKRRHHHRKKKDKKRRRREADASDDDASDDGSDGSGGALRGAPATWRCALDGFALPRDAAALAQLLADAAADAWLRAAQARADETRDEHRR